MKLESMNKIVIFVCALLGLSITSFGMDKPITLPNAEELKVRLTLLDRNDLIDHTLLVKQLADEELTPL